MSEKLPYVRYSITEVSLAPPGFLMLSWTCMRGLSSNRTKTWGRIRYPSCAEGSCSGRKAPCATDSAKAKE